MSSLVPRESPQPPDRQGPGRPPASIGLSVDSVEWTGNGPPDFADMQMARPTLGGRELHAVVMDEGLVRRRQGASGDAYYRKRFGWVVSTTGVVLVRAEQALQPDAHGRMRPHGRFVASSLERPDVGQPQRRVGEVAASGTASPEATTSAHGMAATAARPKGYWRDSPFAPAGVRHGLEGLIPRPEFQVAQALSHNDGARFTVALLVVSDLRIAAVQCSRLAGATHWQVEQLTFDVDARGSILSRQPDRGVING